MKKIILLVVYYGKWPEWVNLFIETCKWNPTIDWLIISDCAEPENKCKNVKYMHVAIEELNKLVSRKLGINFQLKNPYKLCDLKLAYGDIFEDYICGYDYFGWSDIDVFYGNIRKFLTEDLLEYDLISFGELVLSNYFLVLKNSVEMRRAYLQIEGWDEKMMLESYAALDDVEFIKVLSKERIYIKESFTTPSCTMAPWRDGTFIYPSEWYWRRGKITNNKDLGVDFPFCNFMVWKRSFWGNYSKGKSNKKQKIIVNVDYKNTENGWKINKRGLF